MGKPYTIKFGPWSPDLQDVGVEMPFQWTDTELPVADCLNVYWQDGSYRCLPGLSSIGPSLGTPILDAFTWYDNTAQKEVLFAATANGFFTMVDNVWTEISTQTTEGATGFTISMQLGSVVGLATWMTTQSAGSGTSSSYTYPSAFVANVGYGTPSGYNWYFGGSTGPGTWSIASGQGTANAIPEVTGSTSGSTSSATLYCDITFSGTVYTISGPVSYVQESVVATPTFSPAAGSYSSSQSVTISDSTPGATIYYTTDGSTPTTGSTVYSGAIPVSSTETIKAIAAATGYVNSAVASATYTISSPILHTYTASGTETVPSGYTNVVIEVWGGGGGTGSADSLGGGGSGYSRSSYACSGGQTLSYIVGNGGGYNPSTNHGTAGQASSVSSGSLAITTLTANGGNGSVSGSGGSASGGNQANATGGAGTDSAGGAPSAGVYANASATNGHGSSSVGSNGSGTIGLVSFYYT